MTLLDLIRSGSAAWAVFLLIALAFLLGGIFRYRRTRSRSDLPRVIGDLMTTFLVVLVGLHLGLGVPFFTFLLIPYGLVLAALFIYRMRVVEQVTSEMHARQKAMSEANRAKDAANAMPIEAGTPAPEPESAPAGHEATSATPTQATQQDWRGPGSG